MNMANRSLFQSLVGALLPWADARNEENAPAYRRSSREALAQFAATGCLNATFYASAGEQLAAVLDFCGDVEPEFLARTAVYCRTRGYMKDMPALLLAALSRRDPALMDRVFDRVVNSPRVLRTFVQIVRSGATGRKSLGSAPKRCVRRWLDQRTDAALFAASVGNAPSLADIVRMVHPKPATRERAALYAYLVGRDVARDSLPLLVRQFEDFKAGDRREVPAVPFEMLTALDLTPRDWAQVAEHASWQMTRMNLNTFARHGVFEAPQMTERIAARLSDRAEIAKARAFPYQLLAAFRSADASVPAAVRRAIEDAMEISLENVPAVDGQVYVCPDVSSSMLSPVTGYRESSTTAVQCVDVAALITAALLQRNPTTEVLPFNDAVVPVPISARDSVLGNAKRLAAAAGGGTSVSAPLALLNAQRARGDLVVIVSDNQSWVDASGARGTATLREWTTFGARNPGARLVLIDLQPYATTQAVNRADILNVGGFSDHVFDVVSEFAAGRLQHDHWVGQIDAVVL
jgi:60 kDa SS-A/Ro ribonucleoprotein